MDTGRRQRFYWRAFVTFYVIFSFIVIAVSGLVLYVAPPGRVANWSQWRFAALLKADWQAVHTVFSLLFLVAAGFHVYFNWRVILNYLKRKVGEGINRGREFGVAAIAGTAIVVCTLVGVPPLSTIVSFGETAKNSWADPATEPPVPHAELWTVAKFAESNKLTVDQAMENLRRASFVVPTADVTLQAVATTYNVTPREVYLKALGDARPAPMPLAEGGGFGRKTVGQLCEQLNIPVETGLERLRQAGFEGVRPDSNLRELAARSGKMPVEAAQALQGLPVQSGESR